MAVRYTPLLCVRLFLYSSMMNLDSYLSFRRYFRSFCLTLRLREVFDQHVGCQVMVPSCGLQDLNRQPACFLTRGKEAYQNVRVDCETGMNKLWVCVSLDLAVDICSRFHFHCFVSLALLKELMVTLAPFQVPLDLVGHWRLSTD